MIYWDTSCVVKLYTAESDSVLYAGRALRAAEPLAISALVEVELSFCLARKEATGDLLAGGARAVMSRFRHDVAAGRFRSFPLGGDVLAQASALAAGFLQRNPRLVLRTLDGLHLATATLVKAAGVCTTDVRMADAARAMGLRVI